MILCSIYAILYNYLFRGKNATMLPHWGSISYMPCFRICSSSTTDKKLEKEKKTVWRECYNLDNYIGYGDRTFLIGLSFCKYPNKDDRRTGIVFFRTDRLLSFKGRHTEGRQVHVDIEAGIGWDRLSKQVQCLFGLQGKFRLHECCSLDIAVSHKTPGFKEGITASGDGWTVSGGITLHI